MSTKTNPDRSLYCPLFADGGVGEVDWDFSLPDTRFIWDTSTADTDGGIMRAGTSSSYVTQDTANMKFMSFYFDNGAASGDNRGMYLRLALTGGGGGEAARIFTNVDSNLGTAHGAHISLDFDATAGGSECSGLGVAMRGTLHIPNIASWAPTGTYSAVQAEIYSDGANSDPAGMTKLSFIRVCSGGDATGRADVDDDADLFELAGFTSASGNLWNDSTLRVDVGGNTRYLVLSTAEDSLTMTGAVQIGVDGTGHDVTFYGDTASALLLWDQSDDALELSGDARLDLSSCTVGAANTDGGVIKAGTSGSPVTEDTADMRFLNFNFDNGAASGDNRGMYLRLALTGGGGGEAARIFTNVDSNLGTAHGAHISMDFDAAAGGSECSGLGVAMRATLHIPNIASWAPTGTYAPIQSEIYNDGSNSDPAGMTVLSCFRVVNGGDTTGAEDVDDDAFLFDFSGWTSGSAHMWYDNTSNAADGFFKIRLPTGATAYIPYSDSTTWA